jgi:hypothetical protein
MVLINEELHQARMFGTGKPFQPSLMNADKARSLPKRGAPERRYIRLGLSLT